jgi:hypothetical protein
VRITPTPRPDFGGLDGLRWTRQMVSATFSTIFHAARRTWTREEASSPRALLLSPPCSSACKRRVPTYPTCLARLGHTMREYVVGSCHEARPSPGTLLLRSTVTSGLLSTKWNQQPPTLHCVVGRVRVSRLLQKCLPASQRLPGKVPRGCSNLGRGKWDENTLQDSRERTKKKKKKKK